MKNSDEFAVSSKESENFWVIGDELWTVVCESVM